jgi:hypothetical protein
MNVFVIQPNISESSREFAAIDPIRARKQLLECCQILSSVDYHQFGTTWMNRKDGVPYKFPKSHRNHPVILAAVKSGDQYHMTLEVAETLAREFPLHAAGRSLAIWRANRPVFNGWTEKGLTACRTGFPMVKQIDLVEYASLMRAYVKNKHDRD